MLQEPILSYVGTLFEYFLYFYSTMAPNGINMGWKTVVLTVDAIRFTLAKYEPVATHVRRFTIFLHVCKSADALSVQTSDLLSDRRFPVCAESKSVVRCLPRRPLVSTDNRFLFLHIPMPEEMSLAES